MYVCVDNINSGKLQFEVHNLYVFLSQYILFNVSSETLCWVADHKFDFINENDL